MEMNKLLSVSCALLNDCKIVNSVRKFYLALLFEKGKCNFFGSNGSFRKVSENEELVCADMSEADEDKPKNCNFASMLYDLGLLFPSRRTSLRDIYRTIVLSYMNLHNVKENDNVS